MGLFNLQSQEQQAIICLDGEEDLWIKDHDLRVDFWVPTSEMSGSFFVRYLLPSRNGGWRELTGDMES